MLRAKEDLHQVAIFYHHLIDSEVKSLLLTFDKKEGEDTWHLLDEALVKFSNSIQKLPSSTNHDDAIVIAGIIVSAVKKVKEPIINSIMSDRSRLSRTAVNLVKNLSAHLGNAFEPLIDIFIPPLLKLTARANKVSLVLGTTALHHLVENSHIASALTKLQETLRTTKSTNCRLAIYDVVLRLLNLGPAEVLERWVDNLEMIIREGVSDSLGEARAISRKSFEKYFELFPQHGDMLVATLPETAKKNLNITPKLVKSNEPAQSRKPRSNVADGPISAIPVPSETSRRIIKPSSLARPPSADNTVNASGLMKAALGSGAHRVIAPAAEKKALSRPIRTPTVTKTTTESSSAINNSNNRNRIGSTSTSSSRNTMPKSSSNASLDNLSNNKNKPTTIASRQRWK